MSARFPGIKRVLHFAFGRRGLAAEIDEEIGFHFDAAMTELRSRGMSEREAREEAARRFGSVPEYKAALTRIGEARRADVERKELLDTVKQHLSFAWRGVKHRPWFAVTVALTLALGIGANAVMFGIVDRLLFRAPEHILRPEEVRRIVPRRALFGPPSYFSAVTLVDFELLRNATSLNGMAAYALYQTSYGEGANARKVNAGLVSSEFFQLLGVQPAYGRFFAGVESSGANDANTIVLAHEFWQREFNGNRSALGKTIRVKNTFYTIVGVAPAGFTGVELKPVDYWLPLYSAGEVLFCCGRGEWKNGTNGENLHLVTRLAPGSESGAATEVMALERAARPPTDENHRWLAVAFASLEPARAPESNPDIRVALWVACTALIVLVITCANVATLLLSRAVQRRRESAVRLALGIGRARLVGHLVSESVLLALVGGLGALILTFWSSSALRLLVLPDLAWPSALDLRLVLFTLAVSIGTGLVAGLIPAWVESRPDLLQSLKAGGAGGGSRRSLLPGGLIVAQATLSVALLIGAGLFVRSLAQVRDIDAGFDTEGVVVLFPDFQETVTPDGRGQATAQALLQLRSEPLVESAAIASSAPFSILSFQRGYGLDSLKLPPKTDLFYSSVSPGYFRTMGTRVLRGREFNERDISNAPHVAIVDEQLAQLLYPKSDALGHCLSPNGEVAGCVRIVGVVRSIHWTSVLAAPSFTAYIPLTQEQLPSSTFLIIRTHGTAQISAAMMRGRVQTMFPGARSVALQPLQDYVDSATRPWRLGATLFLAFGALALVVAAIGLYSVMACRVEQRRHEMGVRSALGAEWRDLMGLVVREGVQLVATGVVLGLLLAFAAAPAIAPLLYQTSPRDPAVMGVVAVVLLLSAAVACAVPAFRASRVDPLEALKAE